MDRRYIRLKEWGISKDMLKEPTDSYMSGTDGSLEKKPYRLRTDSQGFILTGNPLKNPGAKKKIVLLGGSFVESLFEEEDQRFPAILERALAETGLDYQVLNAGYSGENLLHSYNLFLNKIIPLLRYTETVVFFTSMSDNRALLSTDSYWSKHKMHAPIIDPRNNDRTEWSDAPNPKPQEVLLRSALNLCRELGTEPLIVLSPFRQAASGEDDFLDELFPDAESLARYHSNYRLINSTAAQVAEELKVPVLDACREFAASPRFFYDTLHLNTKGHRRMAEITLDFLEEEIGASDN